MADDQQMKPEVEDFLAHHGVLGMRWGVRRSRGGYMGKASAAKAKSTPVAKGKSASAKKGSAPSVTKAKQTKTDHLAIAKKESHPDGSVTWHVKEKNSNGPVVKAHTNMDNGKATEERVKIAASDHIEKLKHETLKPKNTSPKSMTTEELNEAIRRFQLEKQYKQLIAEQNQKATPKSARVRKEAEQFVAKAVMQGASKALTNSVANAGTALLDAQMKKVVVSATKKTVTKV